MKRFALLAGMFLSFAPVAAHAVLVSFGTGEAVTFRDCIAGATACDGVSIPNPNPTVFAGMPGATSSSAFMSDPNYGSTFGSVSLSGTVGAPILKASAFSLEGKRTNTNSVALQRYTYAGSETTTRTFGGTLTYQQLVKDQYPVGAGVNASIDIFTLPVSQIEAGNTPVSNFFALLDVFSLDGYKSLGSDQYWDAPSTDSGLATLEVTVTLNPGDTIWVWVFLQTPAVDGGFVDAAQTLITSWNDSTNLVPAGTVPEPATLGLLGLALSGLALVRGSRRLSR